MFLLTNFIRGTAEGEKGDLPRFHVKTRQRALCLAQATCRTDWVHGGKLYGEKRKHPHKTNTFSRSPMNDKTIVRLMRVPIPPLHAVYCILIITHNFHRVNT